MSDWLTYAPADFLMFSPEVYWRLFELENAARWPFPLLGPLVLLAALAAAWRWPVGVRVLAALLALAWLSVGWHFVWQRYASINLGMTYLAPAFAVQAALWAWIALRPVPAGARTIPVLVAALVILAYPLAGVLAGRPLAGAEITGIAPDPTALLSIAVAVAFLPRGLCLLALVIPVLWLMSSAAVLGVLGSGQAWLVLGAILGSVALAVTRFPSGRA